PRISDSSDASPLSSNVKKSGGSLGACPGLAKLRRRMNESCGVAQYSNGPAIFRNTKAKCFKEKKLPYSLLKQVTVDKLVRARQTSVNLTDS
ncbi:5058_t:CDS:2, partial [Ambispora leptoticha]